MRVAVLGASGMLGHKLCQVLSQSHEVAAIYRRDSNHLQHLFPFKNCANYGLIDVLDQQRLKIICDHFRPDVILNAVGVIKQKREAKHHSVCLDINAVLPHRLVELCEERRMRLIHFSTDCVFSGKRGMYTLDDVPDPVDLYGYSKYLGEVGYSSCALTIRSSIVGRELFGASGLFEWFFSQRKKEINGYRKAIYTGMTTQQMAEVVDFLLLHERDLSGVWQVASEPISKYDLLCLLNERCGLNVTLKEDTSFLCNRSLDGSRFFEVTGYRVPSWLQMIDDFSKDESHCRYDIV